MTGISLSDASEEQKEKLDKLLSLWSSKTNFFDSCAIAKLQSPPSSLAEHRNMLYAQHQNIVNAITQAATAKIDQWVGKLQITSDHRQN